MKYRPERKKKQKDKRTISKNPKRQNRNMRNKVQKTKKTNHQDKKTRQRYLKSGFLPISGYDMI